MEVQVIKRDNKGEEKRYKSFYWEREESLYEDQEKAFAHLIWGELVKKLHGHEYTYIKDYASYDCAFNRLAYRGEGVYFKGKKIMGIDDLERGITDIEIKNHLFFIKYLDV